MMLATGRRSNFYLFSSGLASCGSAGAGTKHSLMERFMSTYERRSLGMKLCFSVVS